MIIDISSVIPVIHPPDIKIKKEEEAQKFRPVEESSDSSNAEFELGKEKLARMSSKGTYKGVGDRYGIRGQLVRDRKIHSNNNDNVTIDMLI
jgi:hypothetical protein